MKARQILLNQLSFQHVMFNVANAFTILRIVLAPFAYYTGFTGMHEEFFLIFALGGVTDALDGFFARKLKMKSDFGSKLDTIADIIFYPAAISLAVVVPEIRERVAYVLAVIGLMAVAMLLTAAKGKLSIPHRWSAKIATISVYAFVLLSASLGFNPVFFYGTLILITIAAVDKMVVVLHD